MYCTMYCTMYCLSMLFHSTVTSMNKLKKPYNHGLRRLQNCPIYNSAPEMFVNLNMPSCDELLGKIVFNFRKTLIIRISH